MLKKFIVYILKCNDQSYYTGITNNIEKRLWEHQNALLKNSYTHNRRPVMLVFNEEFTSPYEAIEREKQVKGWSRKKKEALIEREYIKLPELSKNTFLKTNTLRQAQGDMKVVFFGTPQFAIPALEKLIESNFVVAAIVTQPDKPTGRKKVMTPPPVKTYALQHDIPVLQAEKILNLKSEILNVNPSLFVVAAYGKIIPQEMLAISQFGSINIHPSLLPLYRGPSPLQAAILNGDSETGVSIMLMDEQMDHGPILWKQEYRIKNQETYESLGNALFGVAAKKLPRVIHDYIAGDIIPQPQDHKRTTYTQLINKENGKADWNKPAQYIERMARAYYPWPGVYTQVESQKLKVKKSKKLAVKILKSVVSKEEFQYPLGTFFARDNKLFVACGSNTILEIQKLQPAGKKIMTGAEFARGYMDISTHKT